MVCTLRLLQVDITNHMMNWIIGGVVALALIAGGVFVANQESSDSIMKDETMIEKESAMMEKDAMQEESAMIKGEGAMMEKKHDAMMKDDVMMKDEGVMLQKGSYEAYAASKLAKANEGDVVLFFRASWCPTCRALDSDIKANMSKIPTGLTILDVNYDTETSLKQKYGVTYQHTLVQVDAQGNLITKWSGGLALSDLVSKVQ